MGIFDGVLNCFGNPSLKNCLGIQTPEDLAKESEEFRKANPEISSKDFPETEKGSGGSGEAEIVEGPNIIGGYLQRQSGDVPGECAGECQSFLDISCYWHKVVNNCGGSTGFCDLVALPGCESWYKYIPIVAFMIIGLILILIIMMGKK